ncbi:MAG: tyrosine-type recombinase/integrase [Coprobacillus cateniformis]
MTKTLFSEACMQVLANKKLSVKYSTYTRYERIIDKNIIPYFEGKTIDEVGIQEINDYFELLIDIKKYSRSTIKLIKYLMNATSEFINTQYNLSSFRKISIKIPNKQERQNITEQQKILLSSHCFLHYDSISFSVLIALYGGLRIGEICALKWEYFDLDEGYTKVNKTIQRLKSKDQSVCKTNIVEDEPKTSTSKRIVPLPEFLIEYIREYRIKNPADDDHYILTQSTKMVEPRTIQKRFAKLCSALGFKINFHALRHCYATSCVEQELDIKSVSEILGHSSVNTTLNLYVHSSFEQKRVQVNKIKKS